jgi:hypothetical protein
MVATAEMHAAEPVASTSEMTSAEVTSATEMSTATVSAATVTATTAVTATAPCQSRTRQHGRDNQNGNSNARLQHAQDSSPTQMTREATQSSPRRSRGSPPLTLSANILYLGQVVTRVAAKLPH